MEELSVREVFGEKAEEARDLFVETALNRHESAQEAALITKGQGRRTYGVQWAGYQEELVEIGVKKGFAKVDLGSTVSSDFRTTLQINGVLVFIRRGSIAGDRFLGTKTASSLLSCANHPQPLFEYGQDPLDDLYARVEGASEEDGLPVVVIVSIYSDVNRVDRITWSFLQCAPDGVSPLLESEEVIWRPEDDRPLRFASGEAFDEGSFQEFDIKLRKQKKGVAGA